MVSAMPSPVVPFLVAFLVCDAGSEDPDTGKKNLIGIFDRLWVATFPTQRPVTLYIKITDAEGHYPIDIEYVQVSSSRVLGKGEGELTISDRTVSQDLLVSLPPMPIPGPGRYEFRLKMAGYFLGNAFFDAGQREA